MRKNSAIIVVSILLVSMFGTLGINHTVLAGEPGGDPPLLGEPPAPDPPVPLMPNSTQPSLLEVPTDNVSWSLDRTNDTLQEFPEPQPTLPDFQVDSIVTSHNYIWEGSEVEITAYVRNTGSYMRNETNVSFYDNIVSNETLIAVEPCFFDNFTATVTTDWTPTGQGIHSIIGIVDQDDAIEESDELNNNAYVSMKIAPPMEEIPDVMVDSGDIRAWDVPAENASSPINITVRNTGNGMANDVNVTVRDMMTGFLVDSYTIPQLGPSSSNTTAVEWRPFYGGPSPLSISLDESSTIEELKEMNNYAQTYFYIATPPSNQPFGRDREPPKENRDEEDPCDIRLHEDLIIGPGEDIWWIDIRVCVYDHDVRIEGSLNMWFSHLLMINTDPLSAYIANEIRVLPGGTLYAQSSAFSSRSSAEPYKFIIDNLGTVTMNEVWVAWTWGDTLYWDEPGGLQIKSGTVSISNSIFLGSQTHGTHGIFIGSGVVVSDPFLNNEVRGNPKAGVYVDINAYVVIDGGKMEDNKYGVYAYQSYPWITNGVLIAGNEFGTYSYFGSPTIDYNLIVNNDYGVYVSRNSQSTISHNEISENSEVGIFLSRVPTSFTPTISHNSPISGNLRGIYARESEIRLLDHYNIPNNEQMKGNHDGVVCISCTGLIQNNYIEGDFTADGHGILVRFSDDRLTIQNNGFYGSEYGIMNMGSSPRILTNRVRARYGTNLGTFGCGIAEMPDEFGIGSSSLIQYHDDEPNDYNIRKAHYGIYVKDSNPEIYNNDFFDLGGHWGARWSDALPISDDVAGENQLHPSVAAYYDDDPSMKKYVIHNVWQENEDGDWDIYYRMKDGDNWGGLIPISEDGAGNEDQMYPSVAVDEYTVHVVWQEDEDGDWDIYYTMYDGGSWSTPVEISEDGAGNEDQMYPKIVAENDVAHVVWQENEDGDWDIYYAKCIGGSCSERYPISEDSVGEDQENPVIATENGKVYVAWQEDEYGSWDIIYKEYNGALWGSPVGISEDMIGEDQINPSISVDNNVVHVAWQENEDGDWDIYYTKKVGTSWTSPASVSDDSIVGEDQTNPSIGAEYGVVHLVWQEDGHGDWDIYYTYHDGIVWHTPILIEDNMAGEQQTYPSISAIHRAVFFTWQEEKSGNPDIYYREEKYYWENPTGVVMDDISSTSVQHNTITQVTFGIRVRNFAGSSSWDLDISYNTFEHAMTPVAGGIGIYIEDASSGIDHIMIWDNDFLWVSNPIYLKRTSVTIAKNYMWELKPDELGVPGGGPFSSIDLENMCFIKAYHGSNVDMYENELFGNIWGMSVTSDGRLDYYNPVPSNVNVRDNLFHAQGYVGVASSTTVPGPAGDGIDNNVMTIENNLFEYGRGAAVYTFSTAEVTLMDNIIQHMDGYADETNGIYTGSVYLAGEGTYEVFGTDKVACTPGSMTQCIEYTNNSGIRLSPLGSVSQTTLIQNNYIRYNGVGIDTHRSYPTDIATNEIDENGVGVLVRMTGLGAIIHDNVIINNDEGIRFEGLSQRYTYGVYSDPGFNPNQVAYNSIGISVTTPADPPGLNPICTPNEPCLRVTNQRDGDIFQNTWGIYVESSAVQVDGYQDPGDLRPNHINVNRYAMWGKDSMVVIISTEMRLNDNGVYLEGFYDGTGGTHKSRILGSSSYKTIIVGNGPIVPGAGIYAYLNSDPFLYHAEVSDFTSSDPTNNPGYGVYVYNSPIGNADSDGAHDIHVHDNTYGIHFYQAPSCLVSNSVVESNERGVVIQEGSYPKIGKDVAGTSNTITGNVNGIEVWSDSYPTIDDNHIVTNVDGYGIYVESSDVVVGEPLLKIRGNHIERTGGTPTGIRLVNSVVQVVRIDPNDPNTENYIEDFNRGISSYWSISPTGMTVITGNTIYDEDGDGWANCGIYLEGYVWPSYVHWIEISFNTIGGYHANGIQIEAGDNPSILIKENKIFSERHVVLGYKAGAGILMKRGGTVEHNEIWDFNIGIQVGTFGSGTSLLAADLTNNLVRDNTRGIYYNGNSREVRVIDNCIESNDAYGIWIRFDTYDTEIANNRISGNGNYGISIDSSLVQNSKIYHNNFISNGATPQVKDLGTSTMWDDGYPSGGNYWSDFSPTCTDLFSGPNQDQPGSDGICDDPYVIDLDSEDGYPFVDPFTGFSCGTSW